MSDNPTYWRPSPRCESFAVFESRDGKSYIIVVVGDGGYTFAEGFNSQEEAEYTAGLLNAAIGYRDFVRVELPTEPTVDKAASLVDSDKLPTSPFDTVTVGHVTIESRYNKAHEFELMAKAVRDLKPELREMIAGIWCDSKATCSYGVSLRAVYASSKFHEETVADALHWAFSRIDGGHNGIYVGSTSVDPDWGVS